MNHPAFHVPAEKFDPVRRRPEDTGVRIGPVLVPREGEVVTVLYLARNGIMLEFACDIAEFMADDRWSIAECRRPGCQSQ